MRTFVAEHHSQLEVVSIDTGQKDMSSLSCHLKLLLVA